MHMSYRSIIKRPADEVYDWITNRDVVERFIPPWMACKDLQWDGDILQLKVKYGCFWSKWVLRETKVKKGEQWELEQLQGPFSKWKLTTKLWPQGDVGTELIDTVDCKCGSRCVMIPYLRYRHSTIAHDLYLLRNYPKRKPLKILITGSHGFVGRTLSRFLKACGNVVIPYDRHKTYDRESLEGFDAVINLAGENIGKGRWTAKKKRAIYESRIRETEKLVALLQQLKWPPKAFLSTSAVGYYGDCGDEELTEEVESHSAHFLSYVARDWESRALQAPGRLVLMRFGAVLCPNGGLLKSLVRPFKLGLGGQLGDGKQYMSWIAMDDLCGAIFHILQNENIRGPVNLVSPSPVTNRVFSETLAKSLKRRLGPTLPAFMVRFLFGEKGEELMLTSTRAVPDVLTKSGFSFQYPTLNQTFEHFF